MFAVVLKEQVLPGGAVGRPCGTHSIGTGPKSRSVVVPGCVYWLAHGAGEHGSQAVVELPMQPPAFFCGGGDQRLPRRLQLLTERGGAQGDGQRP